MTPVLDACDESAASPLDLQGVAAGKLPNEIDAAAALRACRAAVERFPDIPRFVFQLGRAQLASGLADDARKSFAAAAERKYGRAVAELGSLEQLGAFGPANPAKADGYFAACAASGDAYCLYSHGKALFYGQGVAKDVPHGLALMIRAAELGHTYAMNELGFIFTYGRNIAADPERGIRYYEAGAAREDIYSLNNLGLVYMRGKGRPVDLPKALDYFTRSSAGGQPYAPTNLGIMYRDGLGVPVDLEAAAKWLETAAERGDYWGAQPRQSVPRFRGQTARWRRDRDLSRARRFAQRRAWKFRSRRAGLARTRKNVRGGQTRRARQPRGQARRRRRANQSGDVGRPACRAFAPPVAARQAAI